MRTNREHVTMDGNEAKLLDRYEAQFGETPPIAFLDPQTSKRLMMDAIRNNRPFNEKDLESDPEAQRVGRAIAPRDLLRWIEGAYPGPGCVGTELHRLTKRAPDTLGFGADQSG